MQWKWIDKQLLIMLHDESLALHGGLSGLRNEGLLDSALARTPNLANYGLVNGAAPDYADLTAAYAVGLAKNHPFVDGNKRAAFLAVGLFLMLNGKKLIATQVDATLTILDVAAGLVAEEAFAEWLRESLANKQRCNT